MAVIELPMPIVDMVATLTKLKHVDGIVLGGSRARGTATSASDFDIGIYFNGATPLNIAKAKQMLEPLVDAGTRCDLSPVGEWGPWIVGGGWLSVGGHKVDILYRQSDEVSASIKKCSEGEVTIHYQPGHPHGVSSALWMGEIAICKILFDPHGILASLKLQTDPFPRALQESIADRFLWEIGFSIAIAEKAVVRGDVTYIGGSVFRALSCLAQVLFAANKRYLINEKAALLEAADFPITIPELKPAISRIWAGIGAGDFPSALADLAGLDLQIRQLIADL